MENNLLMPKGAMNVLILKALSWGPQHGYGVSRWIREISHDSFPVPEGALYPALHRLEERGFVVAEWGISENNRRAKFYRLTPQGRQELKSTCSSWGRVAEILSRVVEATEAPGWMISS